MTAKIIKTAIKCTSKPQKDGKLHKNRRMNTLHTVMNNKTRNDRETIDYNSAHCSFQWNMLQQKQLKWHSNVPPNVKRSENL